LVAHVFYLPSSSKLQVSLVNLFTHANIIFPLATNKPNIYSDTFQGNILITIKHVINVIMNASCLNYVHLYSFILSI